MPAGAPPITAGAPANSAASPAGAEAPEVRLKRMRMRAWHRGMKEMDLIFGPFADAELGQLDPATLDLFEALMEENDQEIYPWITGQIAPPPSYAAFVARLATFARDRHQPRR